MHTPRSKPKHPSRLQAISPNLAEVLKGCPSIVTSPGLSSRVESGGNPSAARPSSAGRSSLRSARQRIGATNGDRPQAIANQPLDDSISQSLHRVSFCSREVQGAGQSA